MWGRNLLDHKIKRNISLYWETYFLLILELSYCFRKIFAGTIFVSSCFILHQQWQNSFSQSSPYWQTKLAVLCGVAWHQVRSNYEDVSHNLQTITHKSRPGVQSERIWISLSICGWSSRICLSAEYSAGRGLPVLTSIIYIVLVVVLQEFHISLSQLLSEYGASIPSGVESSHNTSTHQYSVRSCHSDSVLSTVVWIK